MAIKKFKPTTPSRRKMAVLNNSELTPDVKVRKGLFAKIKKTDGRNNSGRITVRRRGGAAKRRYRIVDFKRNKTDIPAKITGIVYDPNRTCNLALVTYLDGFKNLILAPAGIKVGDTIISSSEADIKIGNSKKLSEIPVGM